MRSFSRIGRLRTFFSHYSNWLRETQRHHWEGSSSAHCFSTIMFFVQTIVMSAQIFALSVCTVHLVVHCSETGGLAIETKELCCDPCTFSAVLGNVLGMYGHGLAE